MAAADKTKLGGIEDGANVNVSYWNAVFGRAEAEQAHAEGDYDDLTNKPAIPEELSDLSDVDTQALLMASCLRYNGGIMGACWFASAVVLTWDIPQLLTRAPLPTTLVHDAEIPLG